MNVQFFLKSDGQAHGNPVLLTDTLRFRIAAATRTAPATVLRTLAAGNAVVTTDGFYFKA